ncbi:exonuclease domain-containing protein [Aestuariibacter halophilus]|uniref:Exonuclease domain-containing protein n=1 Tax=Fluctibacter halophilus TaxID=226011 RepID=A0ABS8GA60_9ALTE|nr:3'-5' exonuclease [Aestuariibacter halophilus]MCC2617066.1 exonuclease domain-containing protein [Aestuariibacter halophilus]
MLDTEFTAWPGSMARNWRGDNEHREIVQIGACRFIVTATGARPGATFNVLIRPQRNPQLSDYFVKLTGIEQAMIDNMGIDFPSALKQFHDFTHQGQLACFCWGNDVDVLAENCRLHDIAMPPFRQWRDLRQLAQSHGVSASHNDSGQLAQALGIPLLGHNHNALFDVRSIGAALNHWLVEGELSVSGLIARDE